MVQRVYTVAFEGIEARAVDVQVQIAPGLPAFNVGACPTRPCPKRASACALHSSPPGSRCPHGASP